MTRKVYLTGYTGKTPDQLLDLAKELDAMILDVRFSPRSRVPYWNLGPLQKLLGDRYAHCPAFGNRNYKGDGPVELVDLAAGVRIVEASPRPVILLCACKDPLVCHRTFIAHELEALGFSTEEIAAERPASSAPVQLSLF